MTFFRLHLLVSNLGASINVCFNVDMLSLVTVVWIWSRVDLSKQHLLFTLGQSGPFDNTLTELAKNEQLMDGIPKGLGIEHTAQVRRMFQFRSHNTTVYVWGENSGKGHYLFGSGLFTNLVNFHRLFYLPDTLKLVKILVLLQRPALAGSVSGHICRVIWHLSFQADFPKLFGMWLLGCVYNRCWGADKTFILTLFYSPRDKANINTGQK